MYIDTSVIIKLLVPEADSPAYQEALIGSALATSELAHTEVWSALCAKERSGAISASARADAWEEFGKRVRMRQIVLRSLTTATLYKARTIIEQCHPAAPLATLDAIHCATCDQGQDFPLCTADRRMRVAAQALRIPVFPESP